MIAKEDFDTRLQMAEMHEEFIEKMSEAYDAQYYVEAVWYCYSIFEQRISRLISKYIDLCTFAPERTNDKSASISTRIKCLKKVVSAKYGAYNSINIELLDRISKWCDDRNDLVHGLISLKHYRKYDMEFEKLAKVGVPLVFELYDICSDFRNQWYQMPEPTMEFPLRRCPGGCHKEKCVNPKRL